METTTPEKVSEKQKIVMILLTLPLKQLETGCQNLQILIKTVLLLVIIN